MEQQQQQKSPVAPHVMVNISAKQIVEAKQRDSSHCMIAEAVKEALPWATRVSVDLQTIRFSNPKKKLRYIYLTPRTAQIALVRFDQGDKFLEPFSFLLRGAHVTAMANSSGIKHEMTPEHKAKITKILQEGIERIKNSQAFLKKTRIVRDSKSGPPGKQGVPRRVGGKAPPLGNFARIRAFGLRSLDR